MLFDESTLHKLNRLTLIAHKIRAGLFKGDRKSSKHGYSIEFADYRNYTPGDDLRHLDWNVYARLDRPFLKLMQEEEDLAVNVFIDSSTSMDWGEGPNHKLSYAIHLAAAITAIALGAGDQTRIQIVKNTESDHIGPLRGIHQLPRLLNFLEHQSMQSGGATHLDDALRKLSLSIGRPGLIFLISDLFSPQGFFKGLAALQAKGFEIVLLHTLCPAELDPAHSGDLQLVDVETGTAQEITIDGGMRELYRQRLETWRAAIKKECRKRACGYFFIDTSIPWEKVVLYEMRREGYVK